MELIVNNHNLFVYAFLTKHKCTYIYTFPWFLIWPPMSVDAHSYNLILKLLFEMNKKNMAYTEIYQ